MGSHYPPKSLHKVFARERKRAGLADQTARRAAFLRDLAHRQRRHIATVSRLLGHSDI
jgi:hypothetical protein